MKEEEKGINEKGKGGKKGEMKLLDRVWSKWRLLNF